MLIYLPVAEMSVNFFVILAMGGVVGMLSGIFGVGGGFLMTPLLIFIGVPPAIAVGTQANQLVAASLSGTMAHVRKKSIDMKMGGVMLLGGLVGTVIGIGIFTWLKRSGQIDWVVSLSYVFFLGGIGSLMFVESIRSLLKAKSAPKKIGTQGWMHHLPLKVRFHDSHLYISALLPFGIGMFVGVFVAMTGIGGGFILIPAMIYLIGMPAAIVAGTSLFQIVFTTAVTTVLQAWINQTVDIVLALILLVGSVIGAQIGTRVGTKLRGEQARFLLALIVLIVALKLGIDLIIPPLDPFSISVEAGHAD